VDLLKIDRSFVAGLAGDKSGKLTEAIIRLARELDLDTVAEGIEDPVQLETLRKLGCHLGQGFLFARPMSASALSALLGPESSASDRKPRPGAELRLPAGA
jgi:EAL domain-containing protein (putative c-di-GMP-specific phosphodiesterase class I)